ncbi:choice-of-anchor D domain-containing protein, partial [Bacteroidota bacterium]
ALIEKYEGDVIGVEFHTRSDDPFTIPETGQISAVFNDGYVPRGFANRNLFNVGGEYKFALAPNQWDGVCAQMVLAEPVVEVNLFYAVNQSTRKLSATVEAEFLQDFEVDGEIRCNVYILENNLPYQQAGTSGLFNHMHVCRKVIGGVWGTAGVIPNSVKAGDVYSHSYEFDLDPSWKIDDLDFIGVVQEYNSQYSDLRKIINCNHGSEGAPSSELATTGPEMSVKPFGEPFSKVFTLKNVSGGTMTFEINEEISERTPADWTWEVILPEAKISNKSDKTQAVEIELIANQTVDITVNLTPGTTIGAGDISIEVRNKYNPGGLKSKGSMTAFSQEIENLQITDYAKDQYSIHSQMTSAGINDVIDISGGEFDEAGTMLTNLSTVVWNCGDGGEISSSEGSAISSAISDGVNVLIMGGKMVTTINTNAQSLLNYLGVQYLGLCRQGSSTQGGVNYVGYEDDPITDGLDMAGTIYYFTAALRVTGANTNPILKHRNTDTVVATRSIIGDSRAIFIGTNPFYITSSYERDNFFSKCFAWLSGAGPSIECLDELEFDDTEVGAISEMTLTIENKGKTDLEVTEVEVDYEYQMNFMVKGDGSFTVPAEGTYDLVLQFKPGYAIDYDSWIKINSDAENDPVKTVTVSGKGIEAAPGPVISLSVEELDFVDVDVEGSGSQTFDIENTGDESLDVTNITVPGAYAGVFIIDPTSFSVEQDATETVTVTFQPTEVGTFETNLTIVSNNKDGPVQVALSANAIVDVDDANVAASPFSLQAGPNPFAGSTNIIFTLNGDLSREVEIIALDASGRTVKKISNKSYSPGSYEIDFDASGLSSGTYYIVAKTKDYSTQLQLVLVK